jgi:hypothetical protein
MAVDAVVEARLSAGLDHRDGDDGGTAGRDKATAVYLTLPEAERRAVTTAIAEQLGMLWFGNRIEPDDEAAIHPIYRHELVDQLVARGYMRRYADDNRELPRSAEAQLAGRAQRSSRTRRSVHESRQSDIVSRHFTAEWEDSIPALQRSNDEHIRLPTR